MIRVQIESNSVADLQSELKSLLGGLSKDTVHDLVSAVPQSDITLNQADAEPVYSVPEVMTEDSPKGEVGETPEEAQADEPQPTMEEARAALNEYRKAKGLPALKELFARHGVKNFIELPASEYAAVMKEAKEDV